MHARIIAAATALVAAATLTTAAPASAATVVASDYWFCNPVDGSVKIYSAEMNLDHHTTSGPTGKILRAESTEHGVQVRNNLPDFHYWHSRTKTVEWTTSWYNPVQWGTVAAPRPAVKTTTYSYWKVFILVGGRWQDTGREVSCGVTTQAKAVA